MHEPRQLRTPAARQAVTWRAILIALLLAPPQTWWIVQMEMIRNNNWPTMLSARLGRLQENPRDMEN